MFNFEWPKNSLKKYEKKAQAIKSNKEELLINLKEKMQKEEQIFFKDSATNFVFSDGNYDAKIMFIGEAPGEEEDKEGKPFVGRSGQLLKFFLEQAQIKDFYITNIVPWRPPQNRTPSDKEIEIMKPYVYEHIQIIQPEIIVAVGSTSIKAFELKESISKIQGTLIETNFGKIFPIFHPSYALRVASKKKDLWISLLKLKKIFKC